MPAGFAAKRVVEVARAVRGARLVYKKLDSTLRGNVAAELAAAFGAAGRERAIVAPAFPAAGRTTVGGTQLVHGVPVDETEMRDDPQTPVREAHVPTLLDERVLVRRHPGRRKTSRIPSGYAGLWRRTNASSPMRSAMTDLEALVRAVPDPARGALGRLGGARVRPRERLSRGPARETRANGEPRPVRSSSWSVA